VEKKEDKLRNFGNIIGSLEHASVFLKCGGVRMGVKMGGKVIKEKVALSTTEERKNCLIEKVSF
jgi:hypothetical protein